MFLILLASIGLMLAGWGAWRYHGPAPEQEIFRGITYGCERLPDGPDSGGLLHWVRADLNVPGVSLYVTPLNADAVVQGFEYKLQHTSTLVSRQGLAAAVNGTLFNSASSFIRLPGDLAVSGETVIANHIMNHVDPNTYLLWWDDQNIAHLETTKPPSPQDIVNAKWAIGGQAAELTPQWMSDGIGTDWRTAIAANPEKKLVWIACYDKASYRFVAQSLRDHGATIGTIVDGGTSMAMVIGSNAKNVRPGTVTGNWRPVATHFGFYAQPLP